GADPPDRELDAALPAAPPPAHDRVAVIGQLDVHVAESAVAVDVYRLAERRAAVARPGQADARSSVRRREPRGNDRVAARRDGRPVDRAALDAPVVRAEDG